MADWHCGHCGRMYGACDLENLECAKRQYPNSDVGAKDKWRAATQICNHLRSQLDQIQDVQYALWNKIGK